MTETTHRPLPAADKLGRLHARFDVEKARSEGNSGFSDGITRGRIRYLQILARRVCADAGIDEPDWVNESDIGRGAPR